MIRLTRSFTGFWRGIRAPIGYRNYSIDGMAREVDLLIPFDSQHLMQSSWHKKYLYLLGNDSLKLAVYQKLCHTLPTKGGSILKLIVFDMLSFIKKELALHHSGDRAQEFRDLLYFGSNIDDNMAYHSVPPFKWFFIAVGVAVLSKKDPNVLDGLIEKMIEFYMDSIDVGSSLPDLSPDSMILSVMDWYYESVPVDHEMLYNNGPKSLSLELNGVETEIPLPPLPRVKDHNLLVKALIHKELSHSLILPEHPLSRIFANEGIPLNRATVDIVKHDLSFLDGLGDFFVSNETTELIYRLKSTPVLPGYGKATFKSIKTIFSTNTLFSRLALSYKLPFAIGDRVITDVLLKSYLPSFYRMNQPLNLDKFEFYTDHTKNARYEQELLGDYFEQYIGALFLEDPILTQKWLGEIYDNILQLIPPTLVRKGKKNPEEYNYSAWCIDILGRPVK